jgi:LacI family transcriptional regulator
MKRKKRSARLSDVARIAGVSLTTASRVLSEPDRVHHSTLSHVREVMAQLGYVPHGAARALASHRSRTVGAIIPTLDNPIFAGSTQALQTQLYRAGYTLLLGSHEYDLEAETFVASALIQRGVDGMILVGLDHAPMLYRLLETADIPYELTWALDPACFHHSLGFSNRHSAIEVVRHLLALGHREMAVISGYTAQNDRARERVAGVREALQSNGIRLSPEQIIETGFSVANGRKAMAALLEQDTSRRITAIVCGNDILAIGALLEAAARGIPVPDALSVTGFDDIELAAEFIPPLTTIHLPVVEIGTLAGERMLKRINGEEVSKISEVRTELIVHRTHRGARGESASDRARVIKATE